MSAAGAPRPLPRAGFTLLELMVALVVGGVAITAASALYLALGSRADAIEATSLGTSRAANAERLLRLLAANVETRADHPGVRGDAEKVTLDTSCETAHGWPEPCRVRLELAGDGASRRLLLRRLATEAGSSAPADARGVVLRDSLRSGGFVYLVDASHGGSWSAAWAEPSPPPAIAVVLDGDTLLLPVR
jgi:prepilin-type N-terminal cleavage/methylation domain-containing protein